MWCQKNIQSTLRKTSLKRLHTKFAGFIKVLHLTCSCIHKITLNEMLHLSISFTFKTIIIFDYND